MKVAIMALVIFIFTVRSYSQEVTMAAAGDTIFHGQLQRQAYCMDQSSSYCSGSSSNPNFSFIWKFVEHHMSAVDLMFINLEGPSTSKREYRTNVETASSKVFNFDEEAIFQLAKSGVDVATVANNHALDMGQAGISATLDVLERASIQKVGAVRKNESMEDSIAVVERNGIRLAFVGCTHHINGNSDTTDQVTKCFESSSTKQKFNPNKKLLGLIKKLSQSPDIDGVIFTPHWGRDGGWVDRLKWTTAADARKVLDYQRGMAKLVIQNGAMAIIGHHPHVLQEYEIIDGKYVFYSIGNFISNQTPWNWHNRDRSIKDRHLKRMQRRVSVILYLNIVKGTGKAKVKGFKVLPTYMKARSEFEAGSFPSDKAAQKMRTLVPALEMNNFWDGETLEVSASTVKSGAYRFQHHLILARNIIEEIFPKNTWITPEEYQNPEVIFDYER